MLTAAFVLAICLVCQVAEIFDQWDHTLQTGSDTEYTFVVLALCVGVAYSLRWFTPRIPRLDSLREAVSPLRLHFTCLALTGCSAIVEISASPPSMALRI
jgi:hypothetical protein